MPYPCFAVRGKSMTKQRIQFAVERPPRLRPPLRRARSEIPPIRRNRFIRTSSHARTKFPMAVGRRRTPDGARECGGGESDLPPLLLSHLHPPSPASRLASLYQLLPHGKHTTSWRAEDCSVVPYLVLQSRIPQEQMTTLGFPAARQRARQAITVTSRLWMS